MNWLEILEVSVPAPEMYCGYPRTALSIRLDDGGAENAGPLKMQGWKTQDWKTWDQIAGVENAGLENTGT